MVVLLGLMFPLHSQIFEEHRKVLYPPKVKEFIENTDKFVTKNVYHIEGKLILSVIILTDFTTTSKIGYLEYTTQDYFSIDGTKTSFVSYLDYDEIEHCISCLEYIKDNLIGKLPYSNAYEFYYTTKLGGRIGACCRIPKNYNYNPDDLWYIFFNGDPLERDKHEKVFALDRKNADKIINQFKQAKQLIERKMAAGALLSKK